jgi:hypothetical protein
MADEEIRLRKVPQELSARAFDRDYVCEHLYPELLAGKVDDNHVGSLGMHDETSDADGHSAALCIACGDTYASGAKLRIIPDPPQPVSESPLFKDVK